MFEKLEEEFHNIIINFSPEQEEKFTLQCARSCAHLINNKAVSAFLSGDETYRRKAALFVEVEYDLHNEEIVKTAAHWAALAVFIAAGQTENNRAWFAAMAARNALSIGNEIVDEDIDEIYEITFEEQIATALLL